MKNKVIDKKAIQFLEAYLNNPSPTGYEAGGQRIWLDYIKPYIDDYHVDNYGSVVGIINPDAPYKVVIEAHADEISWYVHYITKEGFIYLRRNGGSDHQIAPSKRVNIHTEKGIVRAVFGWPAIHTRNRSQKEKAPSLDNIFLDCGCSSKEEVEALGVHVGCVVTYEDEFEILNKKYFIGRALDNRIGGFAIAQVARKIKEEGIELPFGLYIINAVQEEVGLRGAQMIVESIQPDVAIVTDVTHDSGTPMISKIHEGDVLCGNGPVLAYAPAVQNNLLKHLLDTARSNKIPFQRMALSRVTGTDTDAFAYANGGIPSALISLPQRYMHTTVEMVHRDDVENLIRLIFACVISLNPSTDFRYLR